MALALLNPYKTQQKIAYEFNIKRETLNRYKMTLCDIFPDIGKKSLEELQKQDLDFLEDYKNFIDNEIYLYNIWNLSKGDKANDYYGQFPIRFMKNLLYYYTEAFDLIYDPFAGGATTIDACRFMFRKCIATDLNPIPHRADEIGNHDILV